MDEGEQPAEDHEGRRGDDSEVHPGDGQDVGGSGASEGLLHVRGNLRLIADDERFQHRGLRERDGGIDPAGHGRPGGVDETGRAAARRREPHQLPGVREGAAPDALQVHVAGEVEPARVVETADGPDPAAEGDAVAVGDPGTRPGHRHPQQAGDPVGFRAARQALRHHGNPGAAFVFRGAAIHDTGDLPGPGVEKPAHMVGGKARDGVGLHGEVAQGDEKDQREKRGRPAAGEAACDHGTAAADDGERDGLFSGPFRADGNSGNQGQGQRDHRPGIGRCGKKSGFQRCRHFTRLMAAPSAANFFSRAS